MKPILNESYEDVQINSHIMRFVKKFDECQGDGVVDIRLSSTPSPRHLLYGERQGDGGEGGVVSIYIRNIHRGKELTVFGDGTQTRDFIYVGDVANAYYQSLITNNVNTAYNISTQMETSLNELINILGQISGKPVQKLVAPVREGDIYRSVLCNKEAQEKLGCQFTTSLKEGLECMYAKNS